ncbi:MAG: P1 family peptidase [Dehalococcoidia bacterium]|nr:P1 family peptidase [Dehalococcoidia bacterium]
MNDPGQRYARATSAGSITDVDGIAVGHYTDLDGGTGCTVVLCEGGAVAGVDVRGASPGTRETDLLAPTANVERVQAALLGGGSAFGLRAAEGVVNYLCERGSGHQAPGVRVPIVPAAILFDLNLCAPAVPGPEHAYRACKSASRQRPQEGTVGAGTGATVAKALGRDRAVKGGVGTAALRLGDGTTVGAIVVTNAIGGVHDPESGRVIAGPRDLGSKGMLDAAQSILAPDWAPPPLPADANTTIGVVATDATLTKAQAARLASAAHDGLAIAVRPAHTVHDGDTFFALATGRAQSAGVVPARLDCLTAAAAICVAEAVTRSVGEAICLGGVPALPELSSEVD